MKTLARMMRGARLLLPLVLAIGVLAPFCFRRVADADFGFHLAIGRLVARSGIPYRNALCWTFPNEPWFPTSWLFDWTSFVAMDHFGLLGVQVFLLGLVVLTLVGVFVAARRLNEAYGGWTTPLLALLLVPRVSVRPHQVTWVVLAWVLFLCVPDRRDRLSTERERWDRSFRRRLRCVPLIVVGSNFHSGAIFPAVLFAIFCAEAWLLGGRRPREIALALAGFIALAANPGGLFDLKSVFFLAHAQTVIPIVELEAPTLRRAYPFFVVIPLALLAALREVRRSPGLTTAVITFSAMGIFAVRLMYEFEVVAVPMLALTLEPLVRRAGGRLATLVVATVLAGLGNLRMQYWRALVTGPAWEEGRLPVRAARFVQAEKLDGRMYNGFTEGGYLEWAVPELLWFQDARLHPFPTEFIHEQTLNYDKPAEFQAFLKKWDVEWAVATRLNRYIDGKDNLHDAADWALVYWDDVSEVYVRRDVPRFAPLIQRSEFRHFRPWGGAMSDVEAATRPELQEWAAELQRAAEMDGTVLARCAVATRLGLDITACAVAASFDGSAKWQGRVAKARSLGRAP